MALRASLENARYRWEHTEDWTARELGDPRPLATFIPVIPIA